MNDPKQTSARYRVAAVLFLARSFFSASTIAAFTLTPIIAVALSGSETSAGMPNTIGVLGRVIFAYPLGVLMDRIGRRLALTTGFSMAVLGFLLSIWAIFNSSYIGFLFGALLVGMSRTASDLSRYVAAEVFPFSQRAKVIGILIFAGTVGSVGGPLLVGPSATWMEARGYPSDIGPFVVATVAITISLLIILFFLFPDPGEMAKQMAKEEAAENPHSIENTAARTLREIFSSPLVLLALLAMTLSYFVMSFVMVITPLHMDHHAHSLESVSLVISAHTMGMFGLSFLTGWLIDKFGRIVMIRAGVIVLIAACLIAPISPSLAPLSLALFLLGLGWNFCYVAGSSLLSDALAAHERGRAQGASEIFVAIGAGAASLSVGFVFAQGQYVLVSGAALLISSILLISSFVLARRPNTAKSL